MIYLQIQFNKIYDSRPNETVKSGIQRLENRHSSLRSSVHDNNELYYYAISTSFGALYFELSSSYYLTFQKKMSEIYLLRQFINTDKYCDRLIFCSIII